MRIIVRQKGMPLSFVKKTNGYTFLEIVIVVAIVGLLAALGIPTFSRARASSMRRTCINNLRQIDQAKEMWAMDTGAGVKATPKHQDLVAYIAPLQQKRNGNYKAVFYCPLQKNKNFNKSYKIRNMKNQPTCKCAPGEHAL